MCLNCGSVEGYDDAFVYIDFHENRNRIRRKSVYQRKYYIEIVLNQISQKNNSYFTVKDTEKIKRIFEEIGRVTHLVNKNKRKRMINTKYIMKQIFLMLDINFEIEASKSKKTIASYENYWNDVLILKFDKVMKIVNW